MGMRAEPAQEAAGMAPAEAAAGWIEVEVVRAERGYCRSLRLRLPPATVLSQAVERSGLLHASRFSAPVAGYAVYGERADPERRLQNGDRIELLAALVTDPKQARRRRAGRAPTGRRPGQRP